MTPATAPSALRRLGRYCYRRHTKVLLIWVGLLVVLFGASGVIGTGYSDSFGDFKSEATSGFALLEDGFQGNSGEASGKVVVVADGPIDQGEARAAAEELFASIEEIEDVGLVSPFAGPGQIATEGDLAGRLAFATVNLPGDIDFSAAQDISEEIRDLIPAAEDAGLRVELAGQYFAEFEPPESEVLGIGFAIVILILAFGSVLAMGLPIGTALAGIGAGVAVVGIVSNLTTMPDFTNIIALMLGIGVGIDYALFIVTRFREDVHKGMDPTEAAGHAIDTAGRAVLFAGTTVVISVLGMLVMGLGFIRGLGIGAAIAVVATLAASITLLPALLGFAGDKLEVTRRRGLIAAGLVAVGLVGMGLGITPLTLVAIPLAVVVLVLGFFVASLKQPLKPRKVKPTRETFWYRYSRFVQHHSWLTAIGGVVILAIIALPVFDIRLGFSDEGNYAEDTTTRQAYDLLAEGFGPGSNGQLSLAAEVPAGTDPAVLDGITQAVAATEGVTSVEGPSLSEDGTIAAWQVIPATSPQDEATESLVRTLRGDVLDTAQAGTGLDVLVTSFTAMSVDFSDYLGSRYPIFFAVILGLSFLLLMAVFRSIFVPLKAVLVNLLAMGAAYGAVVAVFQWGWGASLFDLAADGAPIEPFIPMMLFAIVFGLSMDYEVFLLSRMKEEYDRTGDNRNAVADGLAVTARVITAAALIMVVVFGSFLLESDRVVKLMGFGLSIAVFLDATVVRMLLVPATMELIGDRNWWLPKWLDRILPRIHVEGGPEDLGRDDDDPDDDGQRELVGAGVG